MAIKNAHGLLGKLIGDLREVWLEIPGDCHLNCQYCFAYEHKEDFNFKRKGLEIIREDIRPDLLSLDEILENIRQFDEDFPLTEKEKSIGIKKMLAIPAAGEPFVNEKMKTYLYRILDACKNRDIISTVFTTADKITDDDINRLEGYKDNLRLYIKCNSLNPIIQDKLVNRTGYSIKRDEVLEKLIKKGFNNGRLGIVTSIMNENYKEMEQLLIYARTNNLEFDADTIINRGKGQNCKCKLDVNDETEDKELIETLRKLQELDKKYGNDWILTSTYIGSEPCTRFDHHIYIKRNGDVSPCVGSPQIVYGNTKEHRLKDLWESKISKIIRKHEITGVCSGCKNYQDKKCYSCLARSTNEDLSKDKLIQLGKIPTIGCNICGPIK